MTPIPKDVHLWTPAPEKAKIRCEDFFAKGKTVIAFGVPGAFTPPCSNKHVPSFLDNADQLKAKGVDAVVCIAVNDPYVVAAWSKSFNVGDKVQFVCDPFGEFIKAMDLEVDLSPLGLGFRSKRWSMIVKDGEVKALHVEEKPTDVEKTTAAVILQELDGILGGK